MKEKRGFLFAILAELLIFIFCSGITSAYLCWQESADTPNQRGTDGNCGLNYSGSYSMGGGDSYVYLMNDGIWNDQFYGNPPAQMLVNYTKPANALNTSLWTVEDSGAGVNFYGGLSLPEDCWEQNPLQLRVDASGGWINSISYYCRNGTDWEMLRFDYDNYYFYEEGMLWEMTQNPTAQQWNLDGNSLSTANLAYQVGIGTSTPAEALDVIGNIVASGDICISGGNCLSEIKLDYSGLALLSAANAFLENQIFQKNITVKGSANFNGGVYMNGADLSGMLPKITSTNADIKTSGKKFIDITGLNFSVSPGNTYYFRFVVPFRSSSKDTGLKLSLDSPAGMLSAKVQMPVESDGTDGDMQGWITSSKDSVTGKRVSKANTDYVSTIEGIISPSENGILQAKFGSESGNSVTIRKGAIGFLYEE